MDYSEKAHVAFHSDEIKLKVVGVSVRSLNSRSRLHPHRPGGVKER